MNRRDFMTRASALLAGAFASCRMLPELATAAEPESTRFGYIHPHKLQQLTRELSIRSILRSEVRRARKLAPKEITIWDPLPDTVRPLHFAFGGNRKTPKGHYINFRFWLTIDEMATEQEIRQQFRTELSRVLMAMLDHGGKQVPSALKRLAAR